MDVSWGPEDDAVALPQPPFGVASGPEVDDDGVLSAYARGDREPGYSGRFHVEGPTLLAGGDLPVGLRLGPATVLVRLDLPEDQSDARPLLEQALAGEGLSRLDEDSLLAAPVALQVLALRISNWDLWGTDLDDSFAALRRSAVGEQELPTI